MRVRLLLHKCHVNRAEHERFNRLTALKTHRIIKNAMYVSHFGLNMYHMLCNFTPLLKDYREHNEKRIN